MFVNYQSLFKFLDLIKIIDHIHFATLNNILLLFEIHWNILLNIFLDCIVITNITKI